MLNFIKTALLLQKRLHQRLQKALVQVLLVLDLGLLAMLKPSLHHQSLQKAHLLQRSIYLPQSQKESLKISQFLESAPMESSLLFQKTSLKFIQQFNKNWMN